VLVDEAEDVGDEFVAFGIGEIDEFGAIGEVAIAIGVAAWANKRAFAGDSEESKGIRPRRILPDAMRKLAGRIGFIKSGCG